MPKPMENATCDRVLGDKVSILSKHLPGTATREVYNEELGCMMHEAGSIKAHFADNLNPANKTNIF